MRRSIDLTVPPDGKNQTARPFARGYPLVVPSPSDPEPLRMVKLMTVDDAFGAKVVAAKLGVEGIVWQLKGGVDGPYPFGPVHVFVTAEDLEAARAVLAASEPLEDEDDQDEADALDAFDPPSRPDRRALLIGGAIVGLLALAAAELVRMLALG
jgi:hypothetical protein